MYHVLLFTHITYFYVHRALRWLPLYKKLHPAEKCMNLASWRALSGTSWTYFTLDKEKLNAALGCPSDECPSFALMWQKAPLFCMWLATGIRRLILLLSSGKQSPRRRPQEAQYSTIIHHNRQDARKCSGGGFQVFLGFLLPKSKCWDGSQHSKLPLHASHVALQT